MSEYTVPDVEIAAEAEKTTHQGAVSAASKR